MIKKVVSNISKKYGSLLGSIGGEEYYSFPDKETLSKATEAELMECKTGFRAKYIIDAVDTVSAKIELVLKVQEHNIPIISSMGAVNKVDPTQFKITDIYKTKVCSLAKVMRRELKKRHVKKLKVVYSEEKSIRPIDDLSISCRTHCICPPGTKRKCTAKRNIPGSNAFVPSTVGLIIASEAIKDLTSKKKYGVLTNQYSILSIIHESSS